MSIVKKKTKQKPTQTPKPVPGRFSSWELAELDRLFTGHEGFIADLLPGSPRERQLLDKSSVRKRNTGDDAPDGTEIVETDCSAVPDCRKFITASEFIADPKNLFNLYGITRSTLSHCPVEVLQAVIDMYNNKASFARCPVHGCAFIGDSDLKIVQHLAAHMQVTFVNCPHCSLGFSQKSNCTRHIATVHSKNAAETSD
jgi:hypothetical protein